MLWIWSSRVTTKELFLKIAAPKRQAKSLKSTCKEVSPYYICKLYTWNLWKAILSQAFLKGFAKIACDVSFYGTVKNLIIYFAETFRCFSHDQFITLLLFSYFFSPFFSFPLLFFSIFLFFFRCFYMINLLLFSFFLIKFLNRFFLGTHPSGCFS